MSMICSVCGSDKVKRYERKSGRIDFKCECGSKRVPVSSNDEIEDVTGEVERNVKNELTENGYKVFYGGTYVIATHEELREAFMKYCVGGLTMNQVSLAMKWTRQEFNAIKTAFKITKDSLPFTPYEIDELDAEQMAEIVRIEKKRYAHLKFSQQKTKDIEKEITRHNKVDYFTNQMAKRINALDISDYVVTSESIAKATETVILQITDEHAGLEVNSLYNTYNLNVMKDRFGVIASNFGTATDLCDHIVIESTGDLVHGMIHGSTEKNSTYVMDALEVVIGCYIWLIDDLRRKGYTVSFAKANGSHSSLESNPKNRTEEENLGRMLPYALKNVFRNDAGFNYLEPLKGTNHTLIPVGGGNAVLIGHGDEMRGAKGYSEYANNISSISKLTVTEFHLGHLHHIKSEELGGVLVENSLSMCGSDQYASKLGLVGDSGFTIRSYDKLGERNGTSIKRF